MVQIDFGDEGFSAVGENETSKSVSDANAVDYSFADVNIEEYANSEAKRDSYNSEKVSKDNFGENIAVNPSYKVAKKAVANLLNNFLEQEKKSGREDHSINWLARVMGVHRTTVSRILHEKVRADPDICRKLAEAMNIPPEKVLRAAGYLPPLAEGELLEETALLDPEIKTLLLNFGKLPEETQQIIKAIAHEVSQQTLQNEIIKNSATRTQRYKRPPFARKLD